MSFDFHRHYDDMTMVSASEAYEAKHHPMVDGDG